MTNRTIRAAVAAGVAALAVAGCGVDMSPWEGTELDEWGWWACDDFGEQLTGAGGPEGAVALGPAARQEFVGAIAESVSYSDQPDVTESFAVLTRTVEGPGQSWEMGLDVFANACLSNGWDPV